MKINFTWNHQKYTIGDKYPPIFVAEAGVNHNGDLNLARQLVRIAKNAGADIVKFQSFITDEIATPIGESADYIKRESPNYRSWYELLKSLELSKKDHQVLIEECKRNDIVFLSTPYDFQSADMLDDLGAPMFKISSTDVTNIPFISYVAKKEKPLIISTGMSTLREVKEAILAIRDTGNNQIILLQCTSNYPASIENANTRVIDYYHENLKILAGYSDQTVGFISAICALNQGAVLFEKHFTTDRNLPGPDQKASAEPEELKDYISAIKLARLALGSPFKRITSEEKETKPKMQKSIIARRNLQKGHIIAKEDIAIKRPAAGLAPKYFDIIVGKKIKRDVLADYPVRHRDIQF